MTFEVLQHQAEAARQLFAQRGQASVSLLQRHAKLGASEAQRILEHLKEQCGPEQRGEQTLLPVNNALFPENRKHGLLLCGINHGYNKRDAELDAQNIDRSNPFKSFFSDRRVEDHDFRNAVLKWFGFWGYHLQPDWQLAQAFERSLVHTNWIQSATPNAAGLPKGVRRSCVDDAESFLNTCEELRPGLILFFSQELLYAFLSSELRPRVEALFGPVVGHTKRVQADVPGVTRFNVRFQKFERLTAVSLPHATGARGVADAYIQALEPHVRPEIEAWWAEHGRHLGLQA